MKKYIGRILAIFPLLSLKSWILPQPPETAPLKVEVSVLQKRLHEHQKLQSETRARLKESSTSFDALVSMLTALEERQAVQPLSLVQMK